MQFTTIVVVVPFVAYYFVIVVMRLREGGSRGDAWSERNLREASKDKEGEMKESKENE